MGTTAVPGRRTRPRIGILPGDPNGIGPELLAKLLADLDDEAEADVLVIGDNHVIAAGARTAGVTVSLPEWTADAEAMAEGETAHLVMETIAPGDVTPGRATEAAGRSILQTLETAVDLAQTGAIDGICFAPLNKTALHLGGMTEADEMQHIAAHLGLKGLAKELNAVEGLWTTRITSHVALKDVAGLITEDAILAAVRRLHDTISDAGVEKPRLAVAALNPHAGDNGNFGREEIDIIAPAVERAKAEGFDVVGPWPPDSVFLLGKDGRVDGIVAMYHDQSQIAMKMMGFDRGLTLLGGLPMPITSPAQGSAYDIVGKGVARVSALRFAFDLVATIAARRLARASAA
ncbi:MAG: 4-hydroxythreonine-4-phosphate dehydrogenase PdxA [Rhodospirillaceae bacterium]|nr:4-hydroxythreonine-4-phosphate dehydrogenase PdxA [Rhodospirillaceae bacterium]